MIYEYLETLRLTRDSFLEALNSCLLKGTFCENFEFLITRTHKYESKADDIREEIKAMMYGKALIPESRGDIMGLLEQIDTIPGLFEQVLYMLQAQRLILPEFILADVRELVQISMECCDLMIRQVEALFKKNESIRDIMTQIDTNESHGDHIERKILIQLFSSSVDNFQKLQLKELVEDIGHIADQTDRVSKRINIINIKRRV